MGLSLVPVLLLTGNVTFPEIIRQQQAGIWFIGPLFLSFFVFLVSGFAETNRLPFDMPEAESELVAGYHSEYSAMKFAMFMIAEYAHIVTVAAMIATLYFGGWDIPFTDWDLQGGRVQTLASFAFFFAKMFFWIFFVMWIRWTLPRFRYDQLMSLGWKVMLPLALVYIMVIAGAIEGMDAIGLVGAPRPQLGTLRLEPDARVRRVLPARSRSRRPRGESTPSSRFSIRTGGGLMAIGVKVMQRPNERGLLYPGDAQGHGAHVQAHAAAALHHAVSGAAPTDEWQIATRWRGTHRMMTDEQGRSKCVACGLCPQVCPANCIKLVPGEDEAGYRYPLIYEIDEFRCVFCGYCQEVCPEEAIHVGVHYENAEYSRDRFVYDLERLSAQSHPVSTLWDPAHPRGE